MKQVQALADFAKCRDLVKTFWGPEVKFSKVIVKQRKTKRRGEEPVVGAGLRYSKILEASLNFS